MSLDRRRGVIGAPLTHREPLKADGNLGYHELIDTIAHLWSLGHPDIPIHPFQAKRYASYPVILYSLETRSPAQGENKKRYREQIIQDDEETNVIIYGQRFMNVVKFTVVTEQNPRLCEEIMEIFEDFMDEITAPLKQAGASDIFYSRRLPDDEGSRSGHDVEERSVTYQIYLEKLTQRSVNKLEAIYVSVRTFVENRGQEFSAVDGNDFITIPNHSYEAGERLTLYAPSPYVGGSLPPNIHHGWTYEIGSVSGDTIYLLDFRGNPVDPSGDGVGRVYLNDFTPQPSEIEDNYSTATPLL